MTELIVQQFVNWLMIACILTLLSIGYSMLFGVLDVLHFSHGDVAFLTPFIALALFGTLTTGATVGAALWPTLGCVFGSLVGVGIIGALIYLVIIRPFQARDELIVLVATVSLGLAIRQSVRHIVPQGQTAHAFPSLLETTLFNIAGVNIKIFLVVVVALTIALMVGMHYLLNKTLIGLRIRAFAQDSEVAQLQGVNPLRVALFTFFLISAIGGLGAIFFSVNVGAIRFDYGILSGLLGFSAAVIGGLGSLYGAVIGAVVLSAAETISQSVIPNGSAYEQVIAFLIVIGFLIFRPNGILGEKTVDKV